MSNNTLDGRGDFHVPQPGYRRTGTALYAATPLATTRRPPQPRNPGVAPGLLQHLPPPAWPVASGTGAVFSASAAPFPPQASIDAALMMTPRQRLARAQQCVEQLQKTVGHASQSAHSQAAIDQLAACLMHLDCERLPQGGELSRVLKMRGECADPHQHGAMLDELAALNQNLHGLAQVHPALSAPPVCTPPSCRAFCPAPWDSASRP